jgi:CRP-like cAMP-binding protein
VMLGSGDAARVITLHRARDLMVELNILTVAPVHANGVVREAGSVLVVPAEEFRALLGCDPVFGEFVLQTLFRRRRAIERAGWAGCVLAQTPTCPTMLDGDQCREVRSGRP